MKNFFYAINQVKNKVKKIRENERENNKGEARWEEVRVPNRE